MKVISIIDLCQHCNSPFDPMILMMNCLHVQVNVKDEVCGMSSSAECSSSLTGFVNWTTVSLLFTAFQLFFCQRFEINRRNLVVEYFWLLFVQTLDFTVPSATLQIQSISVTSVFRLHRNIILTFVRINHHEIKCQCVNRKFVLL